MCQQRLQVAAGRGKEEHGTQEEHGSVEESGVGGCSNGAWSLGEITGRKETQIPGTAKLKGISNLSATRGIRVDWGTTRSFASSLIPSSCTSQPGIC